MFYQNPSISWWYTLNVEINATMDTSETHKEANWKKRLELRFWESKEWIDEK